MNFHEYIFLSKDKSEMTVPITITNDEEDEITEQFLLYLDDPKNSISSIPVKVGDKNQSVVLINDKPGPGNIRGDMPNKISQFMSRTKPFFFTL